MTPEELEKALVALTGKFDALEKSMLAKEDTENTPKEDVRDISLKKGTAFLREHLKGVLPKEKLDTLSFDEMLLVAEIKPKLTANLNPAPPIVNKTDVNDPRPDYLKPTFGGTA